MKIGINMKTTQRTKIISMKNKAFFKKEEFLLFSLFIFFFEDLNYPCLDEAEHLVIKSIYKWKLNMASKSNGYYRNVCR